mmetsp:Transcript_20691/g.57429  ORF Transcript_20691/g.57429 Transcript_20691/m.57429 type:complete len:501 (-) Transcript_20691:441-1943(-)
MGIMDQDEHGGDAVTKALVEDALAEMQRKKKSKQKHHQQKVETGEDLEARKGKTFSQIELEETGGTVREAEVGMAHVKRAVKRKGKGAELEDTELATNVEDAEEDLNMEAEEEANKEEVELTAFNLNEERETGYFDADGHYVERKNEDEDATDAWLESTEANMASAAARANHEAQLRALEAQDKGASAPLSESAIAALKGRAAKLMLEGETVTRALKRLGGGSKKPVLRSKNKRKQTADESGNSSTADKAAFVELAELVDQLLSAGELDIYTESKYQMQREAELYSRPTILDGSMPVRHALELEMSAPVKQMFSWWLLPCRSLHGHLSCSPLIQCSALLCCASSPPDQDKPGDNSGDDMFAEDSDDEPLAKCPAVAVGTTEPGKAGAATTTEAAAAAGAVAASSGYTDMSTLPVKELQKFLQDRGVDVTGVLEKAELVEKAKAVSQVPEGYVYHAESGYYWGDQDSMYCEAISGGFYNPVTQKWFHRDPESGKFTPWQGQ